MRGVWTFESDPWTPHGFTARGKFTQIDGTLVYAIQVRPCRDHESVLLRTLTAGHRMPGIAPFWFMGGTTFAVLVHIDGLLRLRPAFISLLFDLSVSSILLSTRQSPMTFILRSDMMPHHIPWPRLTAVPHCCVNVPASEDMESQKDKQCMQPELPGKLPRLPTTGCIGARRLSTRRCKEPCSAMLPRIQRNVHRTSTPYEDWT
jgi:hypothetical protein